MIKIKKRQVKVVSLIMAALFLFGIAAMTVFTTKTYAAASVSSTVGIVNYQLIVSQIPDSADAQKTMEALFAESKKNYETKSSAMNDTEKRSYYQQLQQGLQVKEQGLMKAINDKITAAVKVVADAKGFSIVVDSGTAIYGGEDITVEVVKKLTGK
jgi:outer membrane protein